MDREEKQQSSRGTAVGLGMACGFIGAVIGAVGYHFLKKEEEMKQQQYSHSEYVTIPKHNRSEMVAVLGPLEALPYCIHVTIPQFSAFSYVS
jgi:hypothetical protein